jgi:hypothetical protein
MIQGPSIRERNCTKSRDTKRITNREDISNIRKWRWNTSRRLWNQNGNNILGKIG